MRKLWSPLYRRLKPWPLFWGLLGAALFILAFQFSWPQLWQGIFLAIPLMITTTGMGWQAGVALIPIGYGLVWLDQLAGGSSYPGWFYLGLLPVLGLGIIGGHSLFALWHSTERRARGNERRARLLSDATSRLHAAKDEDTLYQALPRLLAEILAFSHAEVLRPRAEGLELVASHRWNVPPGFRVPFDSITGRAFQSGSLQYVADTSADRDFLAAPNAPTTGSELAIPLVVDERVHAVLNIEHAQTHRFPEHDRETLLAFARIAEEALERLLVRAQLEQRMREQQFLARLSRELLNTESGAHAAQRALDDLQEQLDIGSGVVLVLTGGRFQELASTSDLPEAARKLLARGVPWQRGRLQRSWQQRQRYFLEDYQNYPEAVPEYRESGVRAVAILPVTNAHEEVQAIMALISFSQTRSWADHERQLLEAVATALGVALERATLNRQLLGMLEVVRDLAHSDDPDQLYQRVVSSTVQLIPGAEAASILVKQGTVLRFAATYGFDEEALRQVPAFSEEEQLTWYGGDQEAFRAGVPRILQGQDIASFSRASAAESEQQRLLQDAGRLLDLKANICVPIAYSNEVTGILNVDSFTRENAFQQRSLRLAEAFAQQVAVIIRQALYREALEQTVVTDPLTRLGNREGFNRQLKLELARAQRYRQPLTLVMLDIDNFKNINDTLGHQAGDEALIKVAEAMHRERRESDSLYRWGGDEFALIIPQVAPEEARVAAKRYVRAIHRIKLGDLELDASIGLASYPEDGSDSETLLRKADDLMYQHKKRV